MAHQIHIQSYPCKKYEHTCGIGVGSKFLSEIKDGDFAIVDGFTGEIFVDPDGHTIRAYRKAESRPGESVFCRPSKARRMSTKDGKKINIYANIGSVDNIGAVLLNDAGGIGLFRSEFLYLENSDFPTEGQQFHAYKRVLESMAGKKAHHKNARYRC